jgi:O-antigen/teichoic acid export membrane protein
MLAYIMYGVYANFVVGIYLKKKTVYLPLITGAGAVVTMGVNWVAIPYMGVMGPALATFMAYFVMALLLFLVARRLYPVDYEWGRIGLWTVIVGAWFFLGTTVVRDWHPIFRVMLLAVLPGVMWAINLLRADEKTAILRRLGRAETHE